MAILRLMWHDMTEESYNAKLHAINVWLKKCEGQLSMAHVLLGCLENIYHPPQMVEDGTTTRTRPDQPNEGKSNNLEPYQ